MHMIRPGRLLQLGILLLLVALIAVVCIAAISFLGGRASSKLTSTGSSL